MMKLPKGWLAEPLTRGLSINDPHTTHLRKQIIEQEKWEFPSNGPLSSANMALPWILFERDASPFAIEFPSLQIKSIKPMMPFRYLLTGGLSSRSMMPNWSLRACRFVERLLEPRMDYWAMFAQVVLIKTK